MKKLMLLVGLWLGLMAGAHAVTLASANNAVFVQRAGNIIQVPSGGALQLNDIVYALKEGAASLTMPSGCSIGMSGGSMLSITQAVQCGTTPKPLAPPTPAVQTALDQAAAIAQQTTGGAVSIPISSGTQVAGGTAVSGATPGAAGTATGGAAGGAVTGGVAGGATTGGAVLGGSVSSLGGVLAGTGVVGGVVVSNDLVSASP